MDKEEDKMQVSAMDVNMKGEEVHDTNVDIVKDDDEKNGDLDDLEHVLPWEKTSGQIPIRSFSGYTIKFDGWVRGDVLAKRQLEQQQKADEEAKARQEQDEAGEAKARQEPEEAGEEISGNVGNAPAANIMVSPSLDMGTTSVPTHQENSDNNNNDNNTYELPQQYQLKGSVVSQ